MVIQTLARALLVGGALLSPSAGIFAATHTDKVPAFVLPPDDRPCAFFTLEGVAVADAAIKPNDPWFAVPMTYQGFKEIYALLLAAKVSSTPVKVATNGGSACGGYPTIDYIYML